MKKIWMSLFLIGLFLIGSPCSGRAEELKEAELYAHSACLMDGDSGRVLYGKQENEKLPMASTTKIMTCILALENGHPQEKVTASAYAASQPKVHMGVREGEQFLLQDLLYSLMLNSHNDAAVMIAEHIGGTVEKFAEMMNVKAREIGCQDTYFITPNGLDAEDEYGIHSTTAVDLARILRYCMMDSPEKETFLEITGTPSYTFWDCSNTRTFQCINHNALLTMMDGALTGKTGFTGKAGYCYVGAVQWEGKTLIVSLLACGWPEHKGYKWADARKLIYYGLKNYQYRDIFDSRKLKKIPVENGWKENITLGRPPYEEPVYGEKDECMTFPMLLREDENVQVHVQLPETLKAPIEKGEQIGKVQYFIEGKLIKEYPVYAKETIEITKFHHCVKKVGEAYCF